MAQGVNNAEGHRKGDESKDEASQPKGEQHKVAEQQA